MWDCLFIVYSSSNFLSLTLYYYFVDCTFEIDITNIIIEYTSTYCVVNSRRIFKGDLNYKLTSLRIGY